MIGINIINAYNSPCYSFDLSNLEDSESLVFNFDYELYKYKNIKIYAVQSDDVSKKEFIAEYNLTPKIHYDNFNIFNLSSLFLKHKGTLSISIGLSDSSICTSKNTEKYGLCQSELFDTNLNDYNIRSCIEENEKNVKLMQMDSKVNDNYIEVFVQLN